MRSLFGAVVKSVIFGKFFGFVLFGVREVPPRGAVGVRGSGSAFVLGVVEGPSRGLSAWVRGSGSVGKGSMGKVTLFGAGGIRGSSAVGVGDAAGKTLFAFHQKRNSNNNIPNKDNI